MMALQMIAAQIQMIQMIQMVPYRPGSHMKIMGTASIQAETKVLLLLPLVGNQGPKQGVKNLMLRQFDAN
jgi:hypothetical protein